MATFLLYGILAVPVCVTFVTVSVYSLFLGSFDTALLFVVQEFYKKWGTTYTKDINILFGYFKEIEIDSFFGWLLNPTLHLLTIFNGWDYRKI